MNANNKNYQITRRKALTQIVALPVGALGLKTPGQAVKPALYGVAITSCAAGIAGCWELRKSDNAADLAMAFDGVSIYLPILEDIIKYSPHYRQKACELAARCAILKTILSWHCSSHAFATSCAQQAVTYTKQSGDVCLLLSAYSKLAWAYLYEGKGQKRSLALNIALEARRTLEDAEKKHLPIPACIHDGTYSTLALMQVVNKLNCDDAVGKAGELDPGTESVAFMEFTGTDLLNETGIIYQRKGDHTKAMALYTTMIDPKTLIPILPFANGECNRVGVINDMALSVLNKKSRDMEEAIHFWTAGIQGAVALQSEHFFEKALTTYNIMQYVWPGEQRIEDLHELTKHW